MVVSAEWSQTNDTHREFLSSLAECLLFLHLCTFVFMLIYRLISAVRLTLRGTDLCTHWHTYTPGTFCLSCSGVGYSPLYLFPLLFVFIPLHSVSLQICSPSLRNSCILYNNDDRKHNSVKIHNGIHWLGSLTLTDVWLMMLRLWVQFPCWQSSHRFHALHGMFNIFERKVFTWLCSLSFGGWKYHKYKWNLQ